MICKKKSVIIYIIKNVYIEGVTMAVILEKNDSQYFENRKRRYKRIIGTVIIGLVLIAVIAILFIIYQLNNINYSDYTVTESLERIDSSYTQYTNYNGGILRYSKDGAMFINMQGESKWNSTYDMDNPVSGICDDYVVISDVGNKKLEVFNNLGHVTSIEVLYPIIKAEVAHQGVTAVLMDGGDVNYLQFFSPTGQSLVDTRTTVENSGFAVDFSLSTDGEKLVTSNISINEGLIQSKLTFYNFGVVGQNYQAKVVGGFDYGQTLVTKVEFINNDSVVVFGDDRISFYKMEEIPKHLYEETFQTEIKSIAYNDEYIGLVQRNIDGDGDGRYLLTIYNEEGKNELSEEINYNYDHFYITSDEAIFYSNTELNILRLNGKEKCNFIFDKYISNIFPMSSKNEYLIVDQSNINRVKLVK